MSVVSEILSLRSNRASTVSTLLALLDWQKAAQLRRTHLVAWICRGRRGRHSAVECCGPSRWCVERTCHDSHNTPFRLDVLAPTTSLRYASIASAQLVRADSSLNDATFRLLRQ